MPEGYPYALVPDALKEFIRKLTTTGVPDRVDKRYLAALGFKSSNHRRFPGVLKFVRLIDGQGHPTERYRALREGDEGRRKLAGYVKDSYADLFKLFPDAHRKDTEALRDFFRAGTDLGDRAVAAMAATFQTLCSFASFELPPVPQETPPVALEEEAVAPGKRFRLAAGGLTVNVNIQLELPATTDEEVYERLFSAMARHILKFGEE